MNRLRIATVFGTLSLTVYFSVVITVAIFASQSKFLEALTVPLSLLNQLFSESSGKLEFAHDLPVVCTLWLAFVCFVDLAVMLSTIKLKDFAAALKTANLYASRLLIGLHIRQTRRPAVF